MCTAVTARFLLLPVHLCLLHNTKMSFSNTKAASGVIFFFFWGSGTTVPLCGSSQRALSSPRHKTLQGRDELERFWRFLSASDPLWECWQRGLAVPVKMSPSASLWENDFCNRRILIRRVMCFLFYSLCPQINSHREASSTLKASQAGLWLPGAVCSEIGVTIHLLVISPA